MPKQDDPIRQIVIEARRSQILDAAEQVFAENGFHRATTKAIAEQAGISEGTIYNYFENKVDLLVGIMTRLTRLEMLEEELSAEAAAAFQIKDVPTFLNWILKERTQIAAENQQKLLAIMPEVLVNPQLGRQFYEQFVKDALQMVEQHLAWRVEQGDIRAVDLPLTVRVLQGMFMGCLLLRILGDDILATRWDDLADVLTDLLYNGLRPATTPTQVE